jgi:peptidoglycan/xylan/chitin deacetylase (PgdA/CDA1 family)
MNRPKLIATTLMLAASLLTAPAMAQSVALTFDDGPTLAATPLLSPQQRNQAMLDALARHKVKATLYVTAGNGANQPAGYALAKAWGEAGHALGNHTMTHPGIDDPGLPLAQYQQEILDCDAIIKTLPGYRKWYRYTFLSEGAAEATRSSMQAFLKQHGYRAAPVSFGATDWVVADKLVAALTANPNADVAPIRQAYLDELRKNALASVADKGKDEVKVLLLHHNLANALWLDDIIGVFEGLGWTFALPDQAFVRAYSN